MSKQPVGTNRRIVGTKPMTLQSKRATVTRQHKAGNARHPASGRGLSRNAKVCESIIQLITEAMQKAVEDAAADVSHKGEITEMAKYVCDTLHADYNADVWDDLERDHLVFNNLMPQLEEIQTICEFLRKNNGSDPQSTK